MLLALLHDGRQALIAWRKDSSVPSDDVKRPASVIRVMSVNNQQYRSILKAVVEVIAVNNRYMKAGEEIV